MSLRKIIFFAVFSGLFCLSTAIKFIGIDDPFFGAHQFRQLHTLSNIDSYEDHDVDFLKYKINYEPWPSNKLYEAPLFQYSMFLLSKYTGETLITSRTVNIFFGIITSLFVFYIGRILFNTVVGLYGTLFYLVSPISLLFHPSVLPDILSALCGTVAFFLLVQITRGDNHKVTVFLYILTGSMAAMIKAVYLFPVTLFFLFHFFQSIKRDNFLGSVVDYFKYNYLVVLYTSIIFLSLVAWIAVTILHDGNSMVLLHAGKIEPNALKLIKTLLSRILLDLGNPFVFLLYSIGILSLIKIKKSPENLVLLTIVPVYYFMFPINYPHEYYSVILVPFFATVAGCGAHDVERLLETNHLIKSGSNIRVIFVTMAAFVSFFLFFKDNIFSIFSSSKRYHEISQKVGNILEKHQYAYLFMNSDAKFPDDDPFYKATDFMARITKRKFLSSEWNLDSNKEARKEILIQNYYGREPAIMYALGQYGGVNVVEEAGVGNALDVLGDELYAHYRYIIFYKFDRSATMEKFLKQNCCKRIIESDDWLVYDTKS
ncbi:MAG: glycosyltransferase family 39 protein [Magnetococcales bacterium]|nr:glycosyltransferase family 39 protein [Magnetococcales bacterium]